MNAINGMSLLAASHLQRLIDRRKTHPSNDDALNECWQQWGAMMRGPSNAIAFVTGILDAGVKRRIRIPRDSPYPRRRRRLIRPLMRPLRQPPRLQLHRMGASRAFSSTISTHVPTHDNTGSMLTKRGGEAVPRAPNKGVGANLSHTPPPRLDLGSRFSSAPTRLRFPA